MEIEDCPEVRLWRAVIAQAFFDACSAAPTVPPLEDYLPRCWHNKHLAMVNRNAQVSRRREAIKDIADARVWLLSDSPDFESICDAANLNPESVREKAQLLADEGWPIIASEIAETVDAQSVAISMAA